jgi:hypothetical protein
MWIMTKIGFFSIVEKPPGKTCIRARCRKDLENLLEEVLGGAPEIIRTPKNDYAKRTSKTEQRIENGIENQRFVLEMGATYWSKARKWAAEQAITSPDEDGILAVAAAVPRKIPTEKQSWRLIQIKEKLELEGFPKPDAGPTL